MPPVVVLLHVAVAVAAQSTKLEIAPAAAGVGHCCRRRRPCSPVLRLLPVPVPVPVTVPRTRIYKGPRSQSHF